MSFWLILPCSVVIPPRSGIQIYFGTILVYSVLFWCYSVLFQSHFALFWHIPVYSGIIRFICVSFRCQSGSFRYIPVPFCLVPAYSGLFRYIPFRSVPVFSNAPRYTSGRLLFYNPPTYMYQSRVYQLTIDVLTDISVYMLIEFWQIYRLTNGRKSIRRP